MRNIFWKKRQEGSSRKERRDKAPVQFSPLVLVSGPKSLLSRNYRLQAGRDCAGRREGGREGGREEEEEGVCRLAGCAAPARQSPCVPALCCSPLYPARQTGASQARPGHGSQLSLSLTTGREGERRDEGQLVMKTEHQDCQLV